MNMNRENAIRHHHPFRTRYHRDGSVTVWDVYSQCWLVRVTRLSDAVLASLSHDERTRVLRHISRPR